MIASISAKRKYEQTAIRNVLFIIEQFPRLFR